MSRPYDASSEIYSLYSHPPVTRASSYSQTSEPLVTPTDGGYLSGGSKSGNKLTSANMVLVRSTATTPDEQRLTRESALQATAEALSDSQPYGPYFSFPRDQSPSRPTSGLTRRGTTKELIGRFETMSERTRTPEVPMQHLHSQLREGQTTRPGAYPTIEKINKRSPLRQSIRNFLSVFKKSRPMAGREPNALMSVSEATDGIVPPANLCLSTRDGSAIRSQRSSLTVPNSVVQRESLSVCQTPISPTQARHSGSVLHLSRSPISSPDIHPVWTACTATLHSTHLLLTSETPGGNPSTNVISFRDCSDVRSVSSNELESNERAMLPVHEGGDGKVWKVFELIFEGRPKQKFAVHSVGERAAWVSKIWDAILQAQEERSEAASIARRVPVPSATYTTEEVAESTLSESSNQLPTRSSPTCDVNRALPVIPTITQRAPPPKLSLRIPANALQSPSSSPVPKLSPLPRPPTTPIRLPPRSQSPSVLNLDKRSMVKQRLAQLEGGNSPLSARGSPVSVSNESPTPSRVRSAEGDELRREISSASNVVNSLVDSYRTASRRTTSSLSAHSGRLTSPVSALSTPVRSSSPAKSALLNPGALQDLFSPASRYSDDEVVLRPTLSPTRAQQETQDLTGRRMIRLDTDAGPLKTPVATRDEPKSLPNIPVHLREEPRAVPPDPLPAVPQDKSRQLPLVPQATDAHASVISALSDAVRLPQEGCWQADSVNRGALEVIEAKVNTILDQMRERQGVSDRPPSLDLSSVLDKLEALRDDVQGGASGFRALTPPNSLHVDLGQLNQAHVKLDALVDICQHLRERQISAEQDPSRSSDDGGNEQVGEILALLQGAQEQRSTHSEQQTDSIRYLNELNTWLEAFVNHGTSQIESVAAGVQQLCRDLGSVPELQETGTNGEESPPAQGGLLADVRSLLVETKDKEDSAAALHAAVSGLIAAVQEDLKKNAEARNMFTTESVVGLIDRQRQDQERMLRTLGTELSNEIRGERLRFVEAMKEATQINVQMHVEHFKKELTREVMLMTQEVDRLQRERQGLEQQIADLFAFYSKQKQAGAQLLGPPGRPRSLPQCTGRPRSTGPPTVGVQPLPGGPPAPGGVPRRPLPSPTAAARRPTSSFM